MILIQQPLKFLNLNIRRRDRMIFLIMGIVFVCFLMSLYRQHGQINESQKKTINCMIAILLTLDLVFVLFC